MTAAPQFDDTDIAAMVAEGDILDFIKGMLPGKQAPVSKAPVKPAKPTRAPGVEDKPVGAWPGASRPVPSPYAHITPEESAAAVEDFRRWMRTANRADIEAPFRNA